MRRIALMGCGRIAKKRHAPLLSSGEVDGATLAAVCDIDSSKASAMGYEYSVPYFTSIDALMDSVDPDVVSILTPSGLHAQHIKQLLRYRKPLVVEKPLTLALEDAEVVTNLAKHKGVPLFVVKQNRFNPPIVHLRNAILTERIGKIISATVTVRWCRKPDYYKDWHGTWAMAGGVLANQAIHHIDLLTWLLGEPRSVFAYATSQNGLAVEDTLVGVLRYHSGALGMVEVTAATRPKDLEGSLTVLGTRGTVKVGGFAVNKMELWQFADEQPGDDAIRASCETPPDVYGYGHRAFYKQVLECLDAGIPSGIDGRTSLRVVTALYQSVEQEREIDLRTPPYSAKLGVL